MKEKLTWLYFIDRLQLQIQMDLINNGRKGKEVIEDSKESKIGSRSLILPINFLGGINRKKSTICEKDTSIYNQFKIVKDYLIKSKELITDINSLDYPNMKFIDIDACFKENLVSKSINNIILGNQNNIILSNDLNNLRNQLKIKAILETEKYYIIFRINNLEVLSYPFLDSNIKVLGIISNIIPSNNLLLYDKLGYKYLNAFYDNYHGSNDINNFKNEILEEYFKYPEKDIMELNVLAFYN
jgi:hypothetical protein